MPGVVSLFVFVVGGDHVAVSLPQQIWNTEGPVPPSHSIAETRRPVVSASTRFFMAKGLSLAATPAPFVV
jgi:hypothetical protein